MRTCDWCGDPCFNADECPTCTRKVEDMMETNRQFKIEQGDADPNVESVRRKLLERSQVGIAKYGTTTARTDLGELDFLRHAQEEALDLAVYLERLIKDKETKS